MESGKCTKIKSDLLAFWVTGGWLLLLPRSPVRRCVSKRAKKTQKRRRQTELVGKGSYLPAHLGADICSHILQHVTVYECVSYQSVWLILPIQHPEAHSLVPLRNLGLRPGGDGGTLSAPSGGRMQQHNLSLCVCVYLPQVRAQCCMFVRGGHPASAAYPDKDRRPGLQLEVFSLQPKATLFISVKERGARGCRATWRWRAEASGKQREE